GDGTRLRNFAEVAIRAGIEVEWIRSTRPPFERLAAALLPVGGIVLAAGKSSRMPGSQKLLLDIDGVPMVRHVFEAASEGGCNQTVVVYAEEDVRRAIDGRAELVFNARASTGMASSLQAGLKAMRHEIEGAMVLLGDQPLVGSRTVATLLRAWRREGSRPAVAVSQDDDGWAPPVILARELWGELFALTGDAGARQVLQGRPELLDIVPAPGRPDGIAKVTINRPEVRNAFRPATVVEMSKAFEVARYDPAIGVVILTGAGTEAFCSGGDQRVRGEDGYVDAGGTGRLNVLDLQVQIRRLPKPVIAMVAGYAIGGGHVLHVVCDLTIAADNARFGQTGPRVGRFDGGYGAGLAARIVGQKKAREIWFLCEQYDARQALDMGLVNKVVPLADLEKETVAWCRRMLELSPLALRMLKAGLNAADD